MLQLRLNGSPATAPPGAEMLSTSRSGRPHSTSNGSELPTLLVSSDSYNAVVVVRLDENVDIRSNKVDGDRDRAVTPCSGVIRLEDARNGLS